MWFDLVANTCALDTVFTVIPCLYLFIHTGCGWRALVSPEDHAVSHYEFDVLIGADGKRNTLEGFKRKEFRGKLAIAITANFINKRTEAEAKVISIIKCCQQ